jgi:glycosyltransferase involved in cell wall biosynthesis
MIDPGPAADPHTPAPPVSPDPGTSSSGDRLGPRVLAVIPAWNEERTIGAVVEGVRSRLPVLVVDDGSEDATAEVSRRAGATVVSHEENRRKGAALMTGFRWALDHGYDAVITLDADGQHDPADVVKLLDAMDAGAGDLIIGERTFSEMPFPRWFTTPFGSRLLSWALGVRVTDNQSGYRLLTRRFLERVQLTSTGYEMEVEMIWEAVRLGMPIAWVPIRTIYFRERKSGFHPLRDTMRFLRMVWHIWRERRRHEAQRRAGS